MLLTLRNIARVYELKNGNRFFALKDINLSFENAGLVGVIGKSGSGKSTLVNLISRLDKPTDGEIILNGTNYSKIKGRKNYKFFNREIGIVHQSYNLLENESVLFNVSLPLLLSGYSKKKSKQRVLEVLNKVGIDNRLLNKKAAVLSGGEKQRVAIARAVVNDPSVLVCDEPTGALDTTNSIAVMELIKEISKNTLVILVSHNLQLVNKYVDRIIEIADGRVINDTKLHKIDEVHQKKNDRRTRNSSWISKLSLNNYKKRFKRNITSSLALTISLTLLYLVIGFINGKDSAVKNTCYQQFDFASGTISKETKVNDNGMLSLSRSTRPDYNYLVHQTKIPEKYEICLNYSAICPQNIKISYQEKDVDGLLFTPIYSFQKPYIAPNLISKGSIPNGDSLFEVVINDKAYELLKEEIGKDPLYETINLYSSVQTTYISEIEEYITDVFTLDIKARITGISKELKYLQTPKIYYSYTALDEYLKESILINLSTYYDKQITWFDRINDADESSPFSAYSYYLFLKDTKYKDVVYDESFFPEELTFTSQSYLITKSLLDFLEVAEYVVLLFLGITFIGSILILSVMSFASYSEDHKVSAILTSLGAKNDEIQELYLNESIISGLLATVFSILVAIFSAKGVNFLLFHFIEIDGIIKIPFLSFCGIKFLLPISTLLLICLITVISVVIPISFSKKFSIKEELQSL